MPAAMICRQWPYDFQIHKNMTDKIKIFGASDCYGLTKDLSFTIRGTYELKEDVDGAILRKAVDMLEKRFYFLKLSLKRDFRAFYYVENPRPWVLAESDRPIRLNSKESNDQLVAFSYMGNRIYVNVYHGQMDGTGVYRLAKALLYYYCTLRLGRDLYVPDVAKPDDEILPEEYSDVYFDFYKRSSGEHTERGIHKQKPIPNTLKLDTLGLVNMARNRRTSVKITVPQADLMAYCSSYDGSPVTAVALMMAEAVYKIHPDTGKEIVMGIPVNLRPALGVKKSIASTYSIIYIPYSERIRKHDFEMQGTLCRGIVIKNSDPDLIRAQTKEYCQKLKLLQYVPLTGLKQFGARIIAKGMIKAETTGVTYVGKCDFGEMEEYVRSVFYDVDAYGKGIQVILAALGDRFFITIDQDWSEKVYTDSFFSVLRERNISYEINYDGILELPEMNLKNRA